MDNKKPSPLSQAVRRKSVGCNQLRSPMAKRSPLAPVAQKGWLMKQGSEGLMLWKKRWCVLAEHCLFYYKTPEEEKLLGSILLPSYKVSPCTGDDKVHKKFAFKVEHTNMRTYVFAAETREAMVQWMNALSLSTILQDRPRDEEAGFTVTRQPERRNDSYATNGWLPHQPLYANAPPKPRRMGNENSPEPSPDLHPISQHNHSYPYQRPNALVYPAYVPNYQHPNQYYQGYYQLTSTPAASIPTHQVTPRRSHQPPRPHSADFLDYDAKKYYEFQETTTKSSTTNTKMDLSVQRRRPKSSLDIIQNNDDKYYWSEERYAEKMRQSAMYLQQRIAEQPDNFIRSASARLTKQAPEDEESDEVTTYMGGEESMKRLLEWKQRMLASPLTRKPSGSSGRGSAQNELSKYYKQQVLRELERQEARSREELGRRRSKPDAMRYRSRSVTSSSNRYNSYSSDDEENGEPSRERSRRTSLNGKRRSNDDTKIRRDMMKSVVSPDYENLTELPTEPSGRSSVPPTKTYTRTVIEDYPVRPTNTSQEPLNKLESLKNGQPPLVYPLHSAHTNEDNLKQVWSEKLDESKLIKEFSYQYINENKPEEKTAQSVCMLESPPENIVKSRIKQLGLKVKEEDNKEVTMKEPLKMSPPSYLLNEAYVSHLRTPDCLNITDDLQDRRNNKNLKTFALGSAKAEESDVKENHDKNPKSVRDLLADFERKSQLAQERLEHEKSFEDSPGKRCVFSDTETLLYDTSSDTDDRKPPPDPAILTTLKRPDCSVGASADQTEEEGDEEVAAALGRRDRFFSSCREISRKQDHTTRVKKLPKASDERRLSVTDSMVVHEDSDSACSTPTIDMIKDNLEKTLPKENLKSVEREGHYMPMSPSRRISAPPSDKSRSNSSLHSVLYGVEIEETYVEMAEHGPNDSFLAKNRPLFSNSNNSGFSQPAGESHYDFLYRSSSQREPEYMEVNNLITTLKKESPEKEKTNEVPPTPPRSALPDILNSSTAQTAKSDSSDADDESSKDLDSLDTPRHPRFSLSDTFRPASYYLGNIMGAVVERTASENHDSSDSDLVSPPPIPTSPPPLEDLDTSLETEHSLEFNTQPATPRKLKISDHDLSKRLWSKPRQPDSKRLPVTENMIESLDEDDLIDNKPSLPLESPGRRSGVAIDDENCDINLDMYLEDLQLGGKMNPQTYSKDFRSYEMQRNLSENISKNDVSDKNLMKMRYIDDESKPSTSEETEYENLHSMFPPPPPELYESSDQSDRENSFSLYRNVVTVPPPANYCDGAEVLQRTDSAKVRFDPDTLLQKDLDSQAPYYYSDIIKSDLASPSCLPSSSRPRYQPLNNQRENVHEALQGQKRNDIGRKVNPINQLISAEVDDVSDVQKITAELRTTSVDFMGDADKSGSVDVRNIYESDTLQRRKVASQPVGMLRVRTPDLQHPQGIVRNLYPHGLRNKSEEGAPTQVLFQSSAYGRISRSVEGLLEEAFERPMRTAPRGLSDLWDENSLWRDSLRRVSRSLDNLDENHGETTTREAVPSGRRSAVQFATSPSARQPPSGRRSVDTCAVRPKLSREVTYVNDGARRVLSEYEHDYREGRRPPKKPEERWARELPDSGLQDCDDGVHYERLKRDSESLERRRRCEVYLDRYDWDADREVFRPEPKNQAHFLAETSHPHIEPIDRERLRQWDLMSSGTGGDGKTELRNKDETKDLLPAANPPTPHQGVSEASASGSVMRENHMPPPPPPEQSVGPSRPVPAIMLTKDSPQEAENRLDPHLSCYGRGKSPHRTPPSPSNGYPPWESSCSPYDGWQEKAYHDRQPLTDYNVDPRIGNQIRGGVRSGYSVSLAGTLPHTRSTAGDVTGMVTPVSGSVGTLPLVRSTSSRGAYRHPDSRQSREYQQPGKRDEGSGGEGNWDLDLSAGELLGRTHEELVLLLIQLRRQSAGICKAMEACHIEIEAQARLAELETPKRMEHLQKLEELKRHLLELEKQYEKGKPLVNLVDNMVKLGSLYRTNHSPSSNSLSSGGHVREKLEFNQKVQEQRMLAEERREWDRLSPDQNQLQAKVQQLYKLDRLLQEESGTLRSLQQDKELLEKALGGLRHKLQVSKGNPLEADRWRQQQKLLQRELSRVRLMLAHNSKKLEETVAENGRLEQELLILRQKLQANRMELSMPNTSLLETSTTSTTQALEAELRRVQTLVGDLQRQRQELSVQVRQLTEKSDTLVQQIRPGPTGVAGAGAIPGKKKSNGTWLETDLDLQDTQDVGVTSPTTPNESPQHVSIASTESPHKQQDTSRSTTPIYINTDLTRKDVTSPTYSITESQFEGMAMMPMELSEADERMKRYYGIIPREKQEIKTVRIVKRESERRQRDRDRSGNIGLPLTSNAVAKRVAVVDEVDEEESLDSPGTQAQDPYAHFHPTNPFLPNNLSERSMSLPRGFGTKVPPPPMRLEQSNSLRSSLSKRNRVRFESNLQDWSGSESGGNSPNVDSPNRQFLQSPTIGQDRPISKREQLFGTPVVVSESSSPPLSPVYQSEAAREIVEEMARNLAANRRTVPKGRRRHHTVSNIRLNVDATERVGASRARDDLDMERALRPRMNAPDVVRSTLSQRDLKYNESTIDTILGTPNKIVIPERYIPESEPILTAEEQLHRLRKADSIRKMLSESSTLSTPDLSAETAEEERKSSTLKKKVEEEKRQREHLLQLNQILAQQVMEKSKLVAVKALAQLPLEPSYGRACDEDDCSPIQPLPLYQQRENFFS